MKKLNQKNIEIITNFMKGNKLKKFQGSIDVLNESLEQGSWIKRGSVKANSGFYAGLMSIPSSLEYEGYEIGTDLWHEMNAFERCLNYGSLSNKDFDTIKCLELLKNSTARGKEFKVKVPDEVIIAWVELCKEKTIAVKELETARPKPVLTDIKLSPRVTKTLKEMDLNIDLSSVSFPELKKHEEVVEGKNYEGKIVKKKIVWYEVIWPKDTKHGRSRFTSSTCNCEACGKNIPSGRFVPLYARDLNTNDTVSFWLGRDCASNIFGVKDIGIKRENK